jgi:hypothetical protein
LKKVLIVVVATVALLVIGVPTASATDSGFYTYAGGEPTSGSPVGVGSTFSTALDMKSLILNNSGHAAGWIGVQGSGSSLCGATSLPQPWIQAGIEQSSGMANPVFYVEYHTNTRPCANFYTLGPVPAFNTNYTISIKHVGNGQWKPTVDGYTLPSSDDPGVIASDGTVTTGGSMSATDYTTEGWNYPTISQTNAMDFVFSSVSPWTVSGGGFSWIRTNVNDSILNIGTHSFEATQLAYNGSCYPNLCQNPPP